MVLIGDVPNELHTRFLCGKVDESIELPEEF
jgi:hypothetical protein